MASCSANEIYKFSNNKLAQNLLEALNEQRKLKKFCDYAVKTEDGGYIPVHKSVLIVGNSFYEKLFECGFEDSRKDFHLMTGVSTEHAEKLVNYIYTGDIQMSLNDVPKILNNAVFFDMPELVKFCCEVLINSINNENCLNIWRCFRSNGVFIEDSFRLKCAKYIFEKNKNVLDQLKNLTVYELEDILSDGNQNNLDQTCFSVAIEWFLSNFNEREKYVDRLLNKIHLQNISCLFFIENILENETLKNNINFLKVTFEFFKLKKSELIPVNKNEKVKIKSASPIDVLIITDVEILRYSHEEGKIFTTDYLKIPNGPKFNVAITTFGNNEDNIFICGGFNNGYLADCNYFSIKENKWYNLPPMTQARSRHRAINFDNKIYACGRGILPNIRSVEYFDLNLSKWFEAPSMYKGKHLFGLTTLKNCLYAIQNTNDIECFDPRENKWIKYEICDSELTDSDHIYQALNFDDNIIYCIGMNSIHKLDVRNKKWINEPKIGIFGDGCTVSTCFYEDYFLCLNHKYRNGNCELWIRTFDKSSLQEINCSSIPFNSMYTVNEILCTYS